MKRVKLQIPGTAAPLEVSLERTAGGDRGAYTVQWHDHREDVVFEMGPQGAGILRRHSAILPFYVVQREQHLQVWVGGRSYLLERVDGGARRTQGALQDALAENLIAPMPGTILQIKVTAGSRFDAHEPLIIMESMKMEMTLSAPQPGRVTAMLCEVGQLVELGALLATLEAEADEAET